MLDVRSTFHAELVAELHDAAEAAGYDVLLSTVTPTRDSRRAIETLVDSRCEALVLLAPDAPTARLNTLGEQIPVVVVGRRLRSTTLDVVRTADDHGVTAAVEHLVELGHRDIAFVDGGQSTIATDRRSGYLRAMRRHGLADRVRVLAGDQTEVAGTSAAKDLVGSEHPPTAVVTYNDRVALGLLDGLLRAGVAVPEEMSVVGYDDSPSAHLPHVDLTTVSQDTRRQAENAVHAAVERLDGARTTPRQVVLEPRLVVRRTTSAPRARAELTRGAVNGAAARSTAP
jgi:DNA-binding LacI/PurR family transcriptional regulator